MFACPYCQHETTRKDSLFLHLLTHQESPVFSCDKCEFVTKWRTSLNQHAWLHEETTLYQCPNCPYKSRYSKHVRRHNKRHGKTKPLTSLRCQYCNFTTADRNYFKLHNKSKHKKEVIFDKSKTFHCVQCDFETCKKCLLTKHCNEEHKRHVCECCGFQANTLWHLNDHKLKHMKEEEVAMFRCAQCEFSTKYKNSLKAHLRRHDSCRRKK